MIAAHFFHVGEKLMKQARAQWKLLTKGEKQSYLTVDTSGKESVPTKENRISVKIEPGQAENVVEEPQEQVKSFKGIRVEICIKWP